MPCCSRNARSSSWSRTRASPASWNGATRGPREVSAADWSWRCPNYYFMQFNAWEYMYYQHGDEAIPKELWVGADSYFKLLSATKPGYTRLWNEIETGFRRTVPVVRHPGVCKEQDRT